MSTTAIEPQDWLREVTDLGYVILAEVHEPSVWGHEKIQIFKGCNQTFGQTYKEILAEGEALLNMVPMAKNQVSGNFGNPREIVNEGGGVGVEIMGVELLFTKELVRLLDSNEYQLETQFRTLVAEEVERDPSVVSLAGELETRIKVLIEEKLKEWPSWRFVVDSEALEKEGSGGKVIL